MVSACIMHYWETLGRRILDACGNSNTVNEVYDYIFQTLEKIDDEHDIFYGLCQRIPGVVTESDRQPHARVQGLSPITE
jgi:hypothetical protein